MGHPGAWVPWYERMFDPKDLSFRPVAEMTDHQRRALPVVERWRNIRRTYQEEGRRRARQGDPLHQAGCMLYWAEGTKNRNTACVTNSDVHLIQWSERKEAPSRGLRPACKAQHPACPAHLRRHSGVRRLRSARVARLATSWRSPPPCGRSTGRAPSGRGGCRLTAAGQPPRGQP